MHGADGLAIEVHHVGSVADQADQRFEEGGLTRPVCANDGDDFAGIDVEIDAEQRLKITVEGGEASGFEYGFGLPRRQ